MSELTQLKTRRGPGSRSARRLAYSGVCLAAALALPFLTGQIPEIGAMLCPMHLPTLLCGFLCGWPWGLAVGVTAPLLRSLLFGMPPMFAALPMALEMGVYGAAAGWLYRRLPGGDWRVYPALLAAMVLGRGAWGGAQYLMAGLRHTVFTPELFVAGAVLGSVPGILLQLLLLPPLVMALERAGLTPGP